MFVDMNEKGQLQVTCDTTHQALKSPEAIKFLEDLLKQILTSQSPLHKGITSNIPSTKEGHDVDSIIEKIMYAFKAVDKYLAKDEIKLLLYIINNKDFEQAYEKVIKEKLAGNAKENKEQKIPVILDFSKIKHALETLIVNRKLLHILTNEGETKEVEPGSIPGIDRYDNLKVIKIGKEIYEVLDMTTHEGVEIIRPLLNEERIFFKNTKGELQEMQGIDPFTGGGRITIEKRIAQEYINAQKENTVTIPDNIGIKGYTQVKFDEKGNPIPETNPKLIKEGQHHIREITNLYAGKVFEKHSQHEILYTSIFVSGNITISRNTLDDNKIFYKNDGETNEIIGIKNPELIDNAEVVEIGGKKFVAFYGVSRGKYKSLKSLYNIETEKLMNFDFDLVDFVHNKDNTIKTEGEGRFYVEAIFNDPEDGNSVLDTLKKHFIEYVQQESGKVGEAYNPDKLNVLIDQDMKVMAEGVEKVFEYDKQEYICSRDKDGGLVISSYVDTGNRTGKERNVIKYTKVSRTFGKQHFVADVDIKEGTITIAYTLGSNVLYDKIDISELFRKKVEKTCEFNGIKYDILSTPENLEKVLGGPILRSIDEPTKVYIQKEGATMLEPIKGIEDTDSTAYIITTVQNTLIKQKLEKRITLYCLVYNIKYDLIPGIDGYTGRSFMKLSNNSIYEVIFQNLGKELGCDILINTLDGGTDVCILRKSNRQTEIDIKDYTSDGIKRAIIQCMVKEEISEVFNKKDKLIADAFGPNNTIITANSKITGGDFTKIGDKVYEHLGSNANVSILQELNRGSNIFIYNAKGEPKQITGINNPEQISSVEIEKIGEKEMIIFYKEGEGLLETIHALCSMDGTRCLNVSDTDFVMDKQGKIKTDNKGRFSMTQRSDSGTQKPDILIDPETLETVEEGVKKIINYGDREFFICERPGKALGVCSDGVWLIFPGLSHSWQLGDIDEKTGTISLEQFPFNAKITLDRSINTVLGLKEKLEKTDYTGYAELKNAVSQIKEISLHKHAGKEYYICKDDKSNKIVFIYFDDKYYIPQHMYMSKGKLYCEYGVGKNYDNPLAGLEWQTLPSITEEKEIIVGNNTIKAVYKGETLDSLYNADGTECLNIPYEYANFLHDKDGKIKTEENGDFYLTLNENDNKSFVQRIYSTLKKDPKNRKRTEEKIAPQYATKNVVINPKTMKPVAEDVKETIIYNEKTYYVCTRLNKSFIFGEKGRSELPMKYEYFDKESGIVYLWNGRGKNMEMHIMTLTRQTNGDTRDPCRYEDKEVDDETEAEKPE